MSFDALNQHPATLPSNSHLNVVSFNPEVNHPAVLKNHDVDVGEIAKKVFASLALTVTNILLTVTVSVMKLTGFTIATSLILGHLSRPLHALNEKLSEHAFTPFKKWSEVLGNENKRIIETDKVIKIENKKLYFNTQNYVKAAKDSFKAVVAPISATLTVVNAALWVAVKPLWAAFLAPGLLADILVTAPIALNQAIGHGTYAPLKGISDWMRKKHCDYLDNVVPKSGF